MILISHPQTLTCNTETFWRLSLDVSIFDTGPVMVLIWGGEFSGLDFVESMFPLQFVTPNCLNILGYTREELLSQNIEYGTLIHKDDIHVLAQRMKEKIDLKDNVAFTEYYRLTKKDGSIIWVSDHSEFKYDDNGILVRITGYISDVTELVKARSEAEKLKVERLAVEKSSQNKMQFLANMSHEIRTPMNGVVGMADVLTKTKLTEQQHEIVNTIIRSGDALITIINDILDFSKIGSGKIELENTPFEISEVVYDVTTLLKTGISNPDIELLIDIHPNLDDTISGDAGRLRQIIMNLVGNALKFTSKGHVLIKVNGKREANIVNLDISITDTGIGIPKDKIETIFEKFNQADNTTTREYGGTGLGLSISLGLAECMGGTIDVRSNVGEGSTFTLKLPFKAHDTHKTKSIGPAIHSNHEQLNVLILDDNAVNLNILTAQVKGMGHRVVSYNTPQKAMNAIKAARDKNIKLDILLIDYNMPDINGGQFLRFMNSHQLQSDSRVLILTSSCDDGIKKRLLNEGAEDVLTKPVKPINLMTAINSTPISLMSSPPLGKNRPIQNNPNQRPVLVVEDDKTNQDLLIRMLNMLSRKYIIANNGQEAIEMWKDNNPSLILMDISMPVLNGLSAAQIIRDEEQKENLPRVPIIAVTAHAFKEDVEKCREAGMDDYLSKPLIFKNLQKKLEEYSITDKILNIDKVA